MKAKTLKRISLISILIIAALVASLVAMIFLVDTQPQAQAADGVLYTAEYKGDNGTLPDGRHETRETIAAKYGVTTGQVFSIQSGSELYKFLNGEYSSYKVGFLTCDVAMSYNIERDGYQIINQNSSAAIFDDIFDGNGYTVKIHGGAGDANSSVEIEDDYDYRSTYRNGAEKYDNSDINVWYEYTGFLVAQNYGTIANVTIDYTSSHNVIEAVWGRTDSGTGDLGMADTDRLKSNRPGVFAAGIVAGLNGYGGVIDNLKINLNNAFTVIKKEGSLGYFNQNAAYSGAIAGRIEDNSKINNCWVNLATQGSGVFAGAQGKATKFGSLDNHNTLAIAGGIVGNIDKGTAQITYCALTGIGQVKAFANRASEAAKFRAYSGGIAGGCMKFAGSKERNATSVADINTDSNVCVNSGQIKGIISSWTGSRFTNFSNKPQESTGSLFDAVGSDDAIESLAILFNLETLMDRATGDYVVKPTSQDGKLVLDSSGNLRNWLEIHPASDGGTMTVMFDTDNSNYDIRIHIVADGHDDFKDSGEMDKVVMNSGRYYQYKLLNGEGGGFIWSGTFASANDSSNHINLLLDDPIYAEIYMINSKNTGKYNYEFGRMGILEYSDTNGNNGVREYNGTAAPLKLPTVTMTNYPAFNTSVFENENQWNISRSGKKIESLSQTYMPGTYNMKVETVLGERTYGYYNEAERMLAWQPRTDYVFTILQGVLSLSSSTTDGWQDSVTFELSMNSESDFDSVEFKRNGEFAGDSEQAQVKKEGAIASYTVNETTGKNGTVYEFYAYKRDKVTEEDVVVAVSESRTVRIDNEAPEISEIKYYMVEDGQERLLSEEDLEDIQEHWTKNRILAKFSVTDNDRSGIARAATETYIEEEVLDENGARNVVVTIDNNKPMELQYIDKRGHESIVNLQLNVDRIEGQLNFKYSTYEKDARFNYCSSNVLIYYVANLGGSGWRLWYSYERDAQGEDIWVPNSEVMVDGSGNTRVLTIDWNMGNVYEENGGADFKIKMVNEAGLYEEVFPYRAGGDRYPNDAIGNYTIWLRVANIYLDSNKLNNIFVNDNGVVKSVEEILQNEEDRAKYFDKIYDGTDEYSKDYQFYTDLSILNTDGFYFNDKLGVMYTPAGMSRPRIDLGSNGIVPVKLMYTTSEAGDTRLSFQVVLEDTDGYNYIVYFTDLSAVNFEEDVEVEEGKYWESVEIDAKIAKREVVIELGSQEAFDSNAIYYYGDEVPKEIEVYVDAIGEYVSIRIETDASSTANINEYPVRGISPAGYGNIEYTINPTTIVINPRPVAVDLRFDDGEIGNIPTGVNAGKAHNIKGTYQDVNGNTCNANIEYILKNKPVNTLAEVGEYTINITLPSGNYVIEGQKSFRFNIARGPLEIKTGVRIKDYTEGQVEYDLIIDEDAKEQNLYSDSDLRVTYYKYLDGAVYNQAEQKIEGKISETPMTECPTERGLYFVKVEFVTTDNPNFLAKSDYADGYLIIVSAATSVNVEKVVLEYYYTAEMFTFDLVDAVAEVRSSSNKQLWSASLPADGIVKVQYRETNGSYEDVAPTPNDGGGWYSETGRYEYRVSYLGNDDYNESYIDVVMIINEAELIGITFNSVEAVYDGKVHAPTVNGLFNYTGLKITFRYGVRQVQTDGLNANEDIKQFNFVDARDYTVYMTVAKDGYSTKELQTTVTIKKAKMEDVSASIVDVVYDGKRHDVTFLGIKYDENGSMTYNGEPVIIAGGNSEGNMYATDVNIEPGVGPSYYSGEVTLRSSNYEDLVLKTHITIRQALLPYSEIGKTLPNKVPSGMNLGEYRGYFIDASGAKIDCALQYRKYVKGNEAQGEIVTPDENGTIADGKYSVWIVIPNDNFYIDRCWTVDVGEINSAELSVGGWVAIGSVAALMVAAVITAIVVVKKRKKAGIV